MREVSSSVNWRLDRGVKIVTETERRREKARGGKMNNRMLPALLTLKQFWRANLGAVLD